MLNAQGQGNRLQQVLAKCWTDEGFKRRLLADPAGTLQAEGARVPAGLTVQVHEDNDRVLHLVIPAKPTELSDQDLDVVTGGVGGIFSASYWYQHPSGFGWGYEEPGGYGPKLGK